MFAGEFLEIRMRVAFQADKLLSQDFGIMVNKILNLVPPSRQMLLFSATFPVSMESFKVSFLHPLCSSLASDFSNLSSRPSL